MSFTNAASALTASVMLPPLRAPGKPAAPSSDRHFGLGSVAAPLIVRMGQKPNGPSSQGFSQPIRVVHFLTVHPGGAS
jgi:hypothetical protein